MMWLVYILLLSNNKFYTGITNNLQKRLNAHKNGNGSKIVKSFLPFKLIYTETCKNKSEALKKEAAIKKLNRKEKERLINVSNR